jgi:hypothetical protein
MLKPQTQQHIRFITVEKPTAWVVVAVLVEMNGEETIAVSQPKVVRVIPKAQAALKGATVQSPFLLSAPVEISASHFESLVSPYFAYIFGSEKSNFITGLAAQPPTFA